MDPALLNEHLHHLEPVGSETRTSRQSGQLELRNWHQVYLLDGHFDQILKSGSKLSAVFQVLKKSATLY
ncbi:MAG: hypothetical protein ACR65R_09150 [Methylomicrobium sp.]